jgi:hypothetical protein
MALESIPFAPSRNIQSIWHDPDTQNLLIRYHHGDRVYRYPGISGADAAGFGQSLSANDYLQVILDQSTGTFVGSIPPGDDDAADIQALSGLLT